MLNILDPRNPRELQATKRRHLLNLRVNQRQLKKTPLSSQSKM